MIFVPRPKGSEVALHRHRVNFQTHICNEHNAACDRSRRTVPGLLKLLSIVICFAGWATACTGGGSNGSQDSASNVQSIAGVDANANGVRDDVEQYIANTYASPSDAETKAALMQYAKVLQATLVDTETPAQANATVAAQHFQDLTSAYQCLGARRPDDWPLLEAELRDVMLDTEARQMAYLKAARQAEIAVDVTKLQFFDPPMWAGMCS